MAPSQVGKLKHLGFVRVLAINAAVIASNLYGCAKRNSGRLKSTVEKAENAVAAVATPAYDRLKGVPDDILVFLDKKVDEATHKFNECAPPIAKNVVSKAQLLVKKTSQLVQKLTEETKVDGPVAAISHAGTISKQLAVNQLAVVWYKANQYPHLHGMFKIVIPTATLWSEKYNKLVKDLTAKGYKFLTYVPLIPVKEMEKAYKQVEAAASKKDDDDTGGKEMKMSFKQKEASAGKKDDDTGGGEMGKAYSKVETDVGNKVDDASVSSESESDKE